MDKEAFEMLLDMLAEERRAVLLAVPLPNVVPQQEAEAEAVAGEGELEGLWMGEPTILWASVWFLWRGLVITPVGVFQSCHP